MPKPNNRPKQDNRGKKPGRPGKPNPRAKADSAYQPREYSRAAAPEQAAAKPQRQSSSAADAARPSSRPAPTPREEGADSGEIICGRNAVLEALKSGLSINKVALADNTDPAFSASVFKLCKERGIPCRKIPKQQLQKVAGADNRGIAAWMAVAEYAEISDMLALAQNRNEPPFIIVLDGVEDPHNLGAVIRTAQVAGCHGVVIPRRRACSITQTVMKTSAGAAAYLPVARVANLNQAADELKAAGCWLVAGDMDGKLLWQVDMKGPLALVLGGEGEGISPLLKKNCDLVAALPMQGSIGSLNVSAAAAVLIYEAVRQRLG